MIGGLASTLVRLVPHIGRSFTPTRGCHQPALALPQRSGRAPSCDSAPEFAYGLAACSLLST